MTIYSGFKCNAEHEEVIFQSRNAWSSAAKAAKAAEAAAAKAAEAEAAADADAAAEKYVTENRETIIKTRSTKSS